MPRSATPCLKRTDYLDRLLAVTKGGATWGELIEVLTSAGAEEDDAHAYLGRLLDEGVLVDDLEPTVTGGGYFAHILDLMERVAADSAVIVAEGRRLKDLDNGLGKMDTTVSPAEDRSIELAGLFDGFKEIVKEKSLFQVDLFFDASAHSLDRRLAHGLREVVEALCKLSLATPQPLLEEFAWQFTARYEEREMLLLEALDPVTGIGYPGIGSMGEWPAVRVRAAEEKMANIGQGAIEGFLGSVLLEAQKNRTFEVALDEATVKRLPDCGQTLPLSMSVTFRVLDGFPGQLWVEGANGCSAANIMARFCYGDESILALARAITEAEAVATGRGAVLAEIVHLPEDRIGNIQQHPMLRQYEIPYLGQVTCPDDHMILLSDLYISVKGGRVVLWSRKLGKRVLPRLTHAYNYRLTSLPVFRFLCDMQGQGDQKHLGFSWGILASRFVFLPRATWKGHVLSRATWQFSAEHTKSLWDTGGVQ